MAPDDVAAVKDLIQRSELRTVEFHEVAARRVQFDGDAPEQDDASVQIQLGHRIFSNEFGIRLVGAVASATREVRVTVAAEYVLTEGSTPPERTILLFANEVAVMTLFPYFREGVSMISAKVFNDPLLLPTIERGTITYDIPEPSPDRPKQ